MIKDIMNSNETVLLNDKQMEALKKNFPACFKVDGSFDIERFKDYISDKLTLSNEGYELKFLGKNYARLLASIDTTTVIVPDEEHNNKPENKDSQNIYISGDNLDGLKQILKSYAGKIKCIYIDPPYNTGSDGFVYNDKFNFTSEDLAIKLSIDEEKAARIIDLTKRGSASHSAWLMFMYPRLLLTRDLLTDDGVIFISIDDNEQSNLKLICDDIFGPQNFISCLSVENNPKGRRNSNFISTSSEYCLIYARSKEKAYFIENVPKSASDMTLDENGNYVHNSGKRVLVGENEFNNLVTNINSEKNYVVYYNKSKNEILTKKEDIDSIDLKLISKGFVRYASIREGKMIENTYTAEKLLSLHKNGALEFSSEKIYEKNYADTIRMKSQLVNRKYEAIISGKKREYSMELTTTGAGTYLKDLLKTDEPVFSAPKNIGFLKLLLTLIDDDEFYVVDFFSGSASTADAIINLNNEKNKKIHYIAIQLPEDLDYKYSNANAESKKSIKKSIEFLDRQKRPHLLNYIGIERIIASANTIKSSSKHSNMDLGFKHYVLKEAAVSTLDKLEKFIPEEKGMFIKNDILSDFGIQTVLTTWLIRDGYGFNADIKAINFEGYTGYYVDKHLYLIEPNISKASIAEIIYKYEVDGDFNPENVVLFGYSFLWTMTEELKINLARLKDTEKNLRINFDVRY